ncbi:MAG: glycoside hydrolase [bacterium]
MSRNKTFALSPSILVWGITIAFVFSAQAKDPSEVDLANTTWTLRINPETLAIRAQPAGKSQIEISAEQDPLSQTRVVSRKSAELIWEEPEKGLTFSGLLEGEVFRLSIRSVDVPSSVTIPVIRPGPRARAYMLPLFEGSYVPVNDGAWREFLVSESPMDTTSGLSIPFWGVDYGDFTITYILENPFNNRLVFEDRDGVLDLCLTHEIQRNAKDAQFDIVIILGKGSPVEPARLYREWIVKRGEFVGLKDKIKKNPDVQKLLGAAHVYLWGDSILSRYDVKGWKTFAKELMRRGKAPEPSPGKRIWELLAQDARDAAAEIASVQYPYDYVKNQLADGISELLKRADFYVPSAWQGVQLTSETLNLLKEDGSKRSEVDHRHLNSLLLASAFPESFENPGNWGDGVSVKMMEGLSRAGFDRLWLGLPSWEGGFNHPKAIEKAKDLGYLIGPYDSYHSIHKPGMTETWETAQFDQDLYERGPIVRADGTKKKGFKGAGYLLSPIAARPYVEKRVNGIIGQVGFNSWFVDCDAYGEVFDDYSPLHPATQADDMRARLDRMAWMSDKHRLVVGSERGAAYAAQVIDFAHGMMTPVIGWGDPDLKDKNSKYYMGAYYPPDGPAVFMKQVPLKEKYYPIYYDPRFRLPLYEIVFHDSVVATHQWGCGSLKFEDQTATVELLELLYGVPPLYHLNLAELKKHEKAIKKHYAFFSPLHKEIGLLPMTAFDWLTPDRLVQRTVFGGRVEIVANFGSTDFVKQGEVVARQSIVVKWLDTMRSKLYVPEPS